MALCAMEANSWGHVLSCSGRLKVLSATDKLQVHKIKVLIALSYFYDEQYGSCYQLLKNIDFTHKGLHNVINFNELTCILTFSALISASRNELLNLIVDNQQVKPYFSEFPECMDIIECFLNSD